MQAQQTTIRTSATHSSDRPTIAGVLSNHIPLIWHQVEPYLINAIAYSNGEFALADIKKQLFTTDKQLWVVCNPDIIAAAVTEVRKPLCMILLCGGKNMSLWHENLVSEIGDWAKDHGCSLLEIIGRPGWEKVLSGWKRTHVVLVKELK